MNNNKHRNENVQSSSFNRQKVCDVIEESTTNNGRKPIAVGTTHLTGWLAFPLYLFSAEVQK